METKAFGACDASGSLFCAYGRPDETGQQADGRPMRE